MTLLVAELVARCFPSPLFSMSFLGNELDQEELYARDRKLFWRLRSGEHGYFINDLGFRGFRPPDLRSPDALRILCVGDSCTFGFGVRYEQTYGVRLERLLSSEGSRAVSSILAATPGYSTFQNLVQLEDRIQDLHPRITVFYVGAWNDYVPAVGASDREQYESSRYDGLALIALLRSALARKPDAEELRNRFASDDDSGPRRVSLQEFSENLDRLLELASRAGSLPCVIVPPLPTETVQCHPIALEYRAALERISRERGALVVDGPAILAAFEERMVTTLPDRKTAGGLFFNDWVHPSWLGHSLIAEQVLATLRANVPDLLESYRRAPPTLPGPLRIVHGESVPALCASTVEVSGLDAPRRQAIDRIWIGDHWIREFELEDTGVLRIHVPPVLESGDHEIFLGLDGKLVPSGLAVGVKGPQLAIELQNLGGKTRLEVKVTGPPHLGVMVWVSDDVRPEPIGTRFGPFHLAETTTPAGAPFFFEAIRLPRWCGVIGPDGNWRGAFDFEQGVAVDGPSVAYFQGLVQGPTLQGIGATTTLCRIELTGTPP